MHFAGRVWRLLVGIKDGLVLILVLAFLWGVYALLTARPSAAAVREGALLVELDGYVVEEAEHVDPLAALLSTRAPVAQYQARDIVRALDAAARDERIEAVVFDLDRFLGGGQVNLGEIAEAIERVRAAKKPVLTYATAYTDDSMLLASHASEVWVNPQGGAMIAGPGGDYLFYAGLLEKLKINVHVYKAGIYKSAVEPYTLAGLSDPARENAQALYGALWEEYKAVVARARPKARIDQMISDPVAFTTNSGGDMARAAKAAGLVDQIGSRVAFGERVQKLVGKDEWDDLPGAYPATPMADWLAANPAPTEGKTIGVVTIAGEIVDGGAGPGSAGGDRIAELLDQAYADDDIAALVVRIDSPGGSVLASELIRDAVARHRARRIPVAVSMANVAASGGYWVATASDRIFAEPETITGSIGVFGVLPSFEGTAAMLGVTTDGVRTGPLSGQPDPIAGFSPELDAIAQAGVDNSYRRFLTRVGEARNMSTGSVDKIAQGRVWDGGSARQIGLVDEYGGLDDALAWAAKAAKLGKDWHAEYFGEGETTYDSLLRQWAFGDGADTPQGRDLIARIAIGKQDTLARLYADLDRMSGVRGLQAYCLACPASVPEHAARGDRASGWLSEALAALLRS